MVLTAQSMTSAATASSPTVDVVICTHTEERFDDLVAAVASIRRQTSTPQRVIVVVDHRPALQARLATLAGAEVIANSGPRGLSGARNTGVAASTADVVAFLDDDAVAAPDWLESLLDAYENPFALGAGGSSIPVWDTGRPPWFPEEYDWVVGCTYRGLPTRPAAVRNLIGSSMSFRRDVVLANGGFRTGSGRVGANGLPMGNEETELCVRAAASDPDTMFVFVPGALVRHRVPAERARLGYFTRRCLAEGLSKANTVHQTSVPGSLRTEREYVTKTLRRAVGEGLVASVRQRDVRGLQRVGAIGLGLLVTASGYIVGRLRLAVR